MKRNIAVLGTGAIGSSVGLDLTMAGHNPILLDQWPAHVESMSSQGLHVVTPTGEFHGRVDAFHLCQLCSLKKQFDIVFLTAKSYDTRWMVELIKPYLKPDAVLVSLQNSLNDEWIAPMIGYQRDIASVVELSANIFEPGRVKRNTDREHTWFALGELHGRLTPRLKDLAQILSSAGKIQVSTNIWGAKWTKLVVNCMTMAVCGILGIPDWEVTHYPKLMDLCIRLGRESLKVGVALGFKLEPIFGLASEDFLGSTEVVLKDHLLTLLSHVGREARNSVLQDHMKGRGNEVEYFNGLVIKKGKQANVPTPLNESVTRLSNQIEQGMLKAELSNLPLVENLLNE